MILKNNFFSIIFLGNFNPAILTDEFLKENKIISNQYQKISENITPLFRNIDYEKIRIIVELERFQVTEMQIKDFKNNMILDIAYNYIEILKYTPLRVTGINLNLDVMINKDIDFLKISEDKELLKMYNSDYILSKISKRVDNKSTEFLELDMQLNKGEDTITRQNLKKVDNNIYKLNYNFEVRKLDVIKENISFIKKNYGNILDLFNKFINKIFGE